MRNLKKVLSLALALVMLLGMMMVGAGAVDTGFKDDADINANYKEAAAVNKALNLMTGDGTNLNPGANITRAEAFILSLRVDGSNADEFAKKWPVTEKPFNDVSTGKWYASYMAYGKEMGLIAGNNGNYNPDGDITVVEYSILLLGKLGFDPARYQGASWNTNAASDALEIGLYDGLGNINYYTHKLTREEACQMVFNALTYSPDGETVYTVTGTDGKELYKGDDKNIASVVLAVNPGSKLDAKKSTKGSLGDKAFGLNSSETVDSFGRKTTTWTANGGVKVVVESSDAILTYTTAITEKKLFADLGVTGRKEAGDYYVVMDEVWYDGVKVAAAEEKGTTTKYWAETDDCIGQFANNAIIAKNDTSTVTGSGNGVTVEIYPTGTANHYKMVIVDQYVAVLTKADIVPATVTTERRIRVTAPIVGETAKVRYFETDEFEAGDVVIYTMSGGEVATMKLAEKVEKATINSYKGGDVVTSAGDYASNSRLAAWTEKNLGEDYDLYLDSCGNIIYIKGETAGPVTTFAYILGTEGKAPEGTLTQSDYTLKVRAVLPDGTVGIYNVKVSKVGSDGYKVGDTVVVGAAQGDYYVAGTDIQAWDCTNYSSDPKVGTDQTETNLKGKVLGYTLKDDTLTLSVADPTSGTVEAGKMYVGQLGAAYTDSTSKVLKTGSKDTLITSDTAFVVIDTTKNKAEVFTGAIKLASGKNLAAAATTQIVMTAANGTTGVANVVFTTEKASIAGSAASTAAGYAYVDASSKTVSLNDKKDPVYTYTATTVDGATVSLTSDKGNITSGVYGYDEKDVIGEAKAATVTTIVGNQICNNGTWMNLSADAVYWYNTGLNEADGNLCAVVTNGEGTVVAVFVVGAVQAPQAKTGTTVEKTALTNTDVKDVVTEGAPVKKFDAITPNTVLTVTDITVPANGIGAIEIDSISFAVRGSGVSDTGTSYPVWNNSNVNPEDVMAFGFAKSNGKYYKMEIKDAAGNNMYTEQLGSASSDGTGMCWVNVVNTRVTEGAGASKVYNGGTSGQLNGEGTELAIGSYTWTVTEYSDSGYATATKVAASGTFAITKN